MAYLRRTASLSHRVIGGDGAAKRRRTTCDRGFAAYATLAPGLCLFCLRSLKRLVLTFKLKWERNLQACAVWAAFSFTQSTALYSLTLLSILEATDAKSKNSVER